MGSQQKWDTGWITAGVGSSPGMGMDYDGYKLKALHPETYWGSNVTIRKQNKYQSQCNWHLTI